jgi:tripartite-type tricarboxylate transporter receptor subunit TctC
MMTLHDLKRLGLALATGLTLITVTGHADELHSGNAINFIIGGNPGGGYDIYARTLGRHLARHLPNNPEIVPMNMPGAGSAKAASYLYSISPKDGSEIGAIYPGAVMEPLLGKYHGLSYDPSKFQYLGTLDSGTRVCMTYKTSMTKTYADAQRRKTILGASQAGGSTRDYAYMLNKLTGTKFDIVSGYKGSVDILLAMERGEIEGMCGYDWSSLKAQRPEWIRDKKVNILLQVGVNPEPTLTKVAVPTLWNFTNNPEDRKVAELIVSQQLFGRPYLAPPGTPANRVQSLRDAFSATVKDQAFLSDAKNSRIDIAPLSGEQVQTVIEGLFMSPRHIIERAGEVTNPPSGT